MNETRSIRRLPVIDFTGYRFGDAARRAQIAREIDEASRGCGFYYLVNHGVPVETITAAFDAARDFFGLPVEDRLACVARARNQNRGYQPLLDTQHPGTDPDVKESFDMGFPLPADDADILAGLPFHAPNAWPAIPGFRVTTEHLYFSMLECGRDVLRAMAESLGADRNFFVARCSSADG